MPAETRLTRLGLTISDRAATCRAEQARVRWPTSLPRWPRRRRYRRNDAFFGRAGVNNGERSAFPPGPGGGVGRVRHSRHLDAEIGAYTTSELALSRALVDRPDPGMVLLADRGFTGFA